MHQADMHIAIPPRPSPLWQDSTSSLSSSGQSSSSTSASNTVAITPAPGRCIHRPLGRPPTPYPGECQLCLVSEHMGEGKEKPALGALVEEEEEATAQTHAVPTEAAEEATPTAREVTDAVRPNAIASTSSSILNTSGTPIAVASENLASPISIPVKPKTRRSRSSWLRKLLLNEPCSTAVEKIEQTLYYSPTSKPSRTTTTAANANTNQTSSAVTNPTSTARPAQQASGARRSGAIDPRCNFAPTTLMPTLGYAYTVENSSWKAPPVVGPEVKRKRVVINGTSREDAWAVVDLNRLGSTQ